MATSDQIRVSRVCQIIILANRVESGIDILSILANTKIISTSTEQKDKSDLISLNAYMTSYVCLYPPKFSCIPIG